MIQLPSIDTAINWFGGGAFTVLVIYLPRLMALRRQSSRDAAARAQDEALESKSGAERDYFDNVLADRQELITDRENWKKTANEAWGLLRAAESQVARLMALQESHEKHLLDRDKQIDRLWKLVVRFAPPAVREALEVEYGMTQPGALDALPPSRKGHS